MREDAVIERIKALCTARGWSYYRLAKESGIAYSTLNTMLNKANAPSFWTLNKICDGFDITLAQFFEQDSSSFPVTHEQRQLLVLWDSLDAQSRALATAYMEGLRERQPK